MVSFKLFFLVPGDTVMLQAVLIHCYLKATKISCGIKGDTISGEDNSLLCNLGDNVLCCCTLGIYIFFSIKWILSFYKFRFFFEQNFIKSVLRKNGLLIVKTLNLYGS